MAQEKLGFKYGHHPKSHKNSLKVFKQNKTIGNNRKLIFCKKKLFTDFLIYMFESSFLK